MSVNQSHRSADLQAAVLTRRSLLQMAGVGAGIFMASAGLSACETGSSSEAEGPTSGASGGTFTAALSVGFPDLDVSVLPYGGALIASLYWAERLYRLDPFKQGELIPELAVELPREVSPTTYRIALREGVVFHDGTEFTAEDVVFTLQWIKNPDIGSLWAPFLDLISEVSAVGSHEIEITLTSPTTLLASRLAIAHIRPHTATEPFQLQPVGTGPYRVASAASEEEIIFERFDGYSGDRELSYDRIELRIVTDANARISGLRTGQFKAIENVPISAFEELSTVSGVKTEAVESNKSGLWYMHCGKPPFDDVRVRQAVAFALDRESMIQAAYLGQAQPAWGGLLSERHPQFVELDLVYSYDPDRAKSLLADAGLDGQPVPVDVLVSDEAALAPIVEQNLRDVGFEPTLIPTTSEVSSTTMSDGNFNMMVSAGAGGDLSFLYTEAELALRQSFTGWVVENLCHWTGAPNAELVSLLNELVAEPEPAAAEEALAKALNLIQEELPLLPVCHVKMVTAWVDGLDGFRPSPSIGILLDGASG